MLVKEFLRKYREDNFELMTQKGYIVLPSHQAQNLLDNVLIAQENHKNIVEAAAITAEDLLEQQVVNARWEKGICYVMTCTPGTLHNGQEVYGMKEHDNELKLKMRLKADYDAYIQQFENKPASDVIEKAAEIAASKFVYEKLMMDGVLTEYAESTEYLLKADAPLEIVRNACMNIRECAQYKELAYVLENEANQDQDILTEEKRELSSMKEVSMC